MSGARREQEEAEMDERIGAHRVQIEFDGGSTYAKLICPETGCQPALTCGEGHPPIETGEREPCDACKNGPGDGCVLAAWFGELGSECLTGTIELDAEVVEW